MRSVRLVQSVKLWRIAAETRRYRSIDLSGAGAAAFPGRWNEEGQAVVYCAPVIPMAVLETAAHIDDGGLPLNRFLVEVDVPGEVWALRETIAVADLSPAWQAIPAGRASIDIGARWLASRRSPILLVPSAIVPEEWAALINPLHPACAAIGPRVVRPFDYQRALRR